MSVSKQLHGWYPTGTKWLPIKANSEGKILIDPEFTTGLLAPICVAASDATDEEKAMAEASKGSTCDGTNDETEIQAANDAANGAEVRLFGNTFNIQTSNLTIDNCVLKGTFAQGEYFSGGEYLFPEDEGTVLNVATSILHKRGGAIRDVMIHVASAFSGVALSIGGANAADYWAAALLPVDNVYLYSDGNTSGTAVKIQYVCSSLFGCIQIRNFQYGLHLYAGSGTHTSANTFQRVNCRGTKYGVKLEDAGNGCGANVILDYQIQPASGTLTALQFVAADGNSVLHFQAHDWVHATYGDVITFDSNSNGNYVRGLITKEDGEPSIVLAISDAGYLNTVVDINGYPTNRLCRAYLDKDDSDVTFQPNARVYGEYISVDVEVNVLEAFNSDGNDYITVGVPTDHAYITQNIDVSAVGRKAITYANQVIDWHSNDYTLHAYYAYDGSAPTTGKAIIYVWLRN